VSGVVVRANERVIELAEVGDGIVWTISVRDLESVLPLHAAG
jgi:hypothetical protein